MNNSHGLDADYFSKKLKLVLKGVNNYTPDEMARELVRLALVANGTEAQVEMVRYSDRCNYGNKSW